MKLLLLVLVVVLAACTAGAPTPTVPIPSSLPTVESSTSTTSTAVTTTTTSTVPIPTTITEATALLSEDLAVLTPEQVREAGLVIGGHRYGLPFPTLFEMGNLEMRGAVKDVLAQLSPWNAQILVGMSTGRPRAVFGEFSSWEYRTGLDIDGLRDRVLTDVFGDLSDVAGGVIRYLLANSDPDGGAAWYDLPDVVDSLAGGRVDSVFEGTVRVVSAVGEVSDYTIRLERFGERWMVTGGAFVAAFPPFFPDELVSPPTEFGSENSGLTPPPLEGGHGAHGSGCDNETTALGDGAWFGFVNNITPTGIVLDVACFWAGDMANRVAVARGLDDLPVPDDYLITNDDSTTQSVIVGPDAPVTFLDYEVTHDYVQLPFDEWRTRETYSPCDFSEEAGAGPSCLVWVYINSGVVTGITEQFLP